MLKKLLSFMLLMTISSSIFCMEEPEGQNSEKHTLKQLAKENKQDEIIKLMDNEYVNRHFNLIDKLIEKFNLEKVLKHLDNFYDMSHKIHHYVANGRYKLVQVFYSNLKTKTEIDSNIDNSSLLIQALYLANGLEECNAYGETNIMYLIRTNQFKEAAELIQHSSTDYILAQDVEGKTALYYAVEKLIELRTKGFSLNSSKLNLDQKIELEKAKRKKIIQKLEEVMVILVSKGASWTEGEIEYIPKHKLIEYYRGPVTSKNSLTKSDIKEIQALFDKAEDSAEKYIAKINAQAKKLQAPKVKITGKARIWSKITTKKIISGGAIIACLAGILYLALSGKSENIAKNISTK